MRWVKWVPAPSPMERPGSERKKREIGAQDLVVFPLLPVDAKNDSGSNTQCGRVFRRFLRVRVLGATRPGRLPRVPGGSLRASPAKGQQCPSEWLDTGGDVMRRNSRWAVPVADGHGDKACVSREVKFWSAGNPDRSELGNPTKVRAVGNSFHIVENSRKGYLVVGADHGINISPQHLWARLTRDAILDVSGRHSRLVIAARHVFPYSEGSRARLAGCRNVASKSTPGFPALPPPPINRGCRGLVVKSASSISARTSEKVNILFFNMSDISDSENDGLSGDVEITLSTSTSTGSESESTRDVTGQRSQTPEDLSGMSDLPSLEDILAGQVREGIARLAEILQVGPSTLPDRRFISEIRGDIPTPPVREVNQTADATTTAERITGQAGTSGREGSAQSWNTDPAGEAYLGREHARGRT
ncbi:hypothetical protein TIFTF001_034094 [Ficus carica]|uniref:Uncharacterized protein n=1 Tax=Ficus carica TaxID=3494 RepID=A0AA88DZU1_FICCA|nr:hypothetical protein TIFTF001_034094 [Ficus carica]